MISLDIKTNNAISTDWVEITRNLLKPFNNSIKHDEMRFKSNNEPFMSICPLTNGIYSNIYTKCAMLQRNNAIKTLNKLNKIQSLGGENYGQSIKNVKHHQ